MSDNLDNAMRVMAEQSRQIERLRAALAQYGIVDRQEDAA